MISAAQAGKINSMSPDAQAVQLGTEAKFAADYGLYVLTCNITADATGEKAVTIPFACEVIDVVVQARATSGSGTVTLKKGANAITNAIAMATDTNLARAGTIDDAYSTLAAGATVTVDANGSTDRGLVSIFVRRV